MNIPGAITNWVTNFDTVWAPYDGDSTLKVHKGFQEAYRAVRPQVRAAIASLRQSHPDLPLYITGHSLGGAIAQHAALDLAVELNEDPHVYTYGSPRVGVTE